MSEFQQRQLHQIQLALVNYHNGELALNSLVQRLEGISDLLEDSDLQEILWSITGEMEIINGRIIDQKRHLDAEENKKLAELLDQLSGVIYSMPPIE